jgi:hypothetical protein
MTMMILLQNRYSHKPIYKLGKARSEPHELKCFPGRQRGLAPDEMSSCGSANNLQSTMRFESSDTSMILTLEQELNLSSQTGICTWLSVDNEKLGVCLLVERS